MSPGSRPKERKGWGAPAALIPPPRPARRLLTADGAGRGLGRRFLAGASGWSGPPRSKTHAGRLAGAALRCACAAGTRASALGWRAGRRPPDSEACGPRYSRCARPASETLRGTAPGLFFVCLFVCLFVSKSDSFFPLLSSFSCPKERGIQGSRRRAIHGRLCRALSDLERAGCSGEDKPDAQNLAAPGLPGTRTPRGEPKHWDQFPMNAGEILRALAEDFTGCCRNSLNQIYKASFQYLPANRA